jgi:hypothetical protein
MTRVDFQFELKKILTRLNLINLINTCDSNRLTLGSFFLKKNIILKKILMRFNFVIYELIE